MDERAISSLDPVDSGLPKVPARQSSRARSKVVSAHLGIAFMATIISLLVCTTLILSFLLPFRGAGCPGYNVVAVHDDGKTLTADLRLSGDACNVYGHDLPNLKLLVEYQTGGFM